ncbi:MAG: glycosyltransferase [Saprospiraceae bacterium]|nr:glycosyltransferase [Saprospiraceae bacterium]
MEYLAYFFALIYFLALSFITIYAFLEFHLLYYYLKKYKSIRQYQPPALKEWPKVTIQLPVFNELYVVERLIDVICKIDYPPALLEIQVLDDSTDETVEIITRKCREYAAKGIDIKHLHRTNRSGYKAGAPKEGLKVASGELITIFDADFLPQPDFLKKCIPYFQNQKIGVVQTRWDHINENYSLLTMLQAFQLNVHFSIEQSGRQSGDLLLQFNGTAGTWRKTAIEEAGGWHSDTLTEDLDLSFRAQLKGWEIYYIQEIGSPAELPAEMNGLKSQQARWMKGGAEVARKLIPVIWQSNLAFVQKLHAITLLLGSSIFVLVLALAVSSVPISFLVSHYGISPKYFAFGLIGTLSIILIHFMANVRIAWNKIPLWKSVLRFIVLFPLFLVFSMGLSLHNSVAVIQGWRGKKSAFVRTPKFNIKSITDRVAKHKYLSHHLSWITVFEGLLAGYFIYSVYWGITTQQTNFLIFHVALALGFASIFLYTIVHISLKD